MGKGASDGLRTYGVIAEGLFMVTGITYWWLSQEGRREYSSRNGRGVSRYRVRSCAGKSDARPQTEVADGDAGGQCEGRERKPRCSARAAEGRRCSHRGSVRSGRKQFHFTEEEVSMLGGQHILQATALRQKKKLARAVVGDGEAVPHPRESRGTAELGNFGEDS